MSEGSTQCCSQTLTWQVVLRLSRDLQAQPEGRQVRSLLPPAPFFSFLHLHHNLLLAITPSPPIENKNSDDGMPPHPRPTSFTSFTLLPRELADRIITLACRAPGPSTPAYENVSFRSPLALDVDTTLSLAQVSKTIDEIVVGILYDAVRITRPSALLELLRTVSTRPQLGMLIKHLHIGAEETLANQKDWPLEMQDREDGERLEYPTPRLRTSLFHPGDDDEDQSTLLPEWCGSLQSWPLEPARLDCQGAAVTAAIRVALESIDVEPYRRGYARSGDKVGLVSDTRAGG